MTERYNRRKSLLSIVFLACVLLPTIAGAEGYVNLVGLPGIDSGSPDMQTFVNSALRIAIIAAALIAVIKLILAGAQYVLSGVITDKENAKRDIRSALVGLLIVLAAVTILVTINPKLATLPTLSALPELRAPDRPKPIASNTGIQGAGTVEGTLEERAAALDEAAQSCRSSGGNFVSIGSSEYICHTGDTNTATLNTEARFNDSCNRNSLSNCENLLTTYNDYIASQEPDNPPSTEEIQSILNEYGEGTDYLFITNWQQQNNFGDSFTADYARQQKTVCEQEFGGAFDERPSDGYSICVIE